MTRGCGIGLHLFKASFSLRTRVYTSTAAWKLCVRRPLLHPPGLGTYGRGGAFFKGSTYSLQVPTSISISLFVGISISVSVYIYMYVYICTYLLQVLRSCLSAGPELPVALALPLRRAAGALASSEAPEFRSPKGLGIGILWL